MSCTGGCRYRATAPGFHPGLLKYDASGISHFADMFCQKEKTLALSGISLRPIPFTEDIIL